MTKLQDQVKSFMKQARQHVADHPSIPTAEVRVLRVRLILEEFLEFAEASGVSIALKEGNVVVPITDQVEFICLADKPVNLLEVADATSDIMVVTEGANVSYGLDSEPFTDAVMENNFTKLEDCWFDEHGKLRKGPNYKPVDLQPVLDKQSK